MCAKASRKASPALCLNSAAAIFEVDELPRSGMASNGIASMIIASVMRLSDQPRASINPCEIGANRNMPADPAAVPRPKAKERFSSTHQACNRGENHAERTGRHAQTKQNTAADMKPHRAGCNCHQQQPRCIEQRAERHYPPGTEFVRNNPEQWLTQAPAQVLQGHGHAEGCPVPTGIL